MCNFKLPLAVVDAVINPSVDAEVITVVDALVNAAVDAADTAVEAAGSDEMNVREGTTLVDTWWDTVPLCVEDDEMSIDQHVIIVFTFCAFMRAAFVSFCKFSMSSKLMFINQVYKRKQNPHTNIQSS